MLSCRTGFMAWLRRVLCAAAVFSQVACSLPTEGTGASTADVDGGTTGGSGGGQAGGGSGGTGATGGVGGTTTHCAAPMSCIPSPPSGWVGYVRMRGEGYPPAVVMGPVCPDESTPERYYSGLAGPAQCAPCSCSNQKGGKCGTAPLFCSKSSTDCSGAQDATGDVDGCGITNGHSGLSTLSCFIGTIPVVSAGTCDPSPADFSNKDPWTGVNDVCVVVGTDGSDSSLRAVDRAGYLASGPDAKVIVATAYFPASEDTRAADLLKDEGYKMSGNAPIYAILREAKDRAMAAGATNVEERPIVGAPVDALVDLAEEVHADLLVVGNVGLSTIAGRLLGSVPANVARRSKTDVLIVHTTG